MLLTAKVFVFGDGGDGNVSNLLVAGGDAHVAPGLESVGCGHGTRLQQAGTCGGGCDSTRPHSRGKRHIGFAKEWGDCSQDVGKWPTTLLRLPYRGG